MGDLKSLKTTSATLPVPPRRNRPLSLHRSDSYSSSMHCPTEGTNTLSSIVTLGTLDSGNGSPLAPPTRWNRLKSSCLYCCQPCLTSENPPPSRNAPFCQRLKYSLMCPPHGPVAAAITGFIVMVLCWASLWALTGAEALPGGNLFAIVVLLVACLIGGFIVEQFRIPSLLGMLLIGFMLRNTPTIDIARDIDPTWSAVLRNLAFVIILIRAGLGLDAGAMKRLKCVCIRLAVMPCVAECVCAIFTAKFLLGFPWVWGAILGFVLGAVSPAVIVPTLLDLQDRGYGVEEGIPTLVIASATIDDIFAIACFGIAVGIAFSQGDLVFNIFRGPLEVIIGTVVGGLFGVMLWYIPSKDQSRMKLFRVVLLLGFCVVSLFASRLAGFNGAGALGCLVIAFIARHGWKSEAIEIDNIMTVLWYFMQPLLFGLIGAEVDISYIDKNTVGLAMIVLGVGLVIRVITSYLCVLGISLNTKEKVFIALSWLPKATVQAAIGSIALDVARQTGASDAVIYLGTQVLTISVLSIIVTAPIGAAAIVIVGPRFLKKTIKISKEREAQLVRPSRPAITVTDDYPDIPAPLPKLSNGFVEHEV